MYNIEKKFSFEAAHLLSGLSKDHPCGSIHGHSYKVRIKIFAKELDERGFIIDFGDLKMFDQLYLHKLFDHALIMIGTQCALNQTGKFYLLPDEFKNTTVENLCKHICDLLLEFFKTINFKNFVKIRVKIFETENNSGEYIYENPIEYFVSKFF
jgi:queuosine biosynthesis protein QueD